MDWPAAEDGHKAAVELKTARLRLLAQCRFVKAGEETEQQPRSATDQVIQTEKAREQMFHTLPRELRDMVYNELSEDTIMQVNSCQTMPRNDPGGFNWDIMDFNEPDHHCLNPDLVGQNVFHEIIETVYRTFFIESPLSSQGDLADFFSRDKFGLGIKPADHVRSMVIEIDEVDFGRSTLLSNFSSLALLRPGVKLDLRLMATANEDCEGFTWSSCCGLRPFWNYYVHQCAFHWKEKHLIVSFFDTLGPMFHILCHLRKAGMRVSISIFGAWEEWSTEELLYEHNSNMEFSLVAWHQLILQKKQVSNNIPISAM
ncbi:hypothetical protein EK21DRAFT_91787 [Setomelanomma holmii]|uniref:Uncharacterized protein n=1 Tax=Setomelanomma holmii TaxID=210430 RepID=A0A9P4H2I3_9PLEO|nr:hypothetical protein EK21DRAFT_91787 [Setomelanomma holmii]